MNELKLSDVELLQRREEIRRGLVRANTAAIAILMLVITLALVAIIAAHRAENNAAAAREATKKLWQTSAVQARASRQNSGVGWRRRALEAVATAVRVRPAVALRNVWQVAGFASFANRTASFIVLCTTNSCA